MGILSYGLEKIRRFGAEARQKREAKLFADTEASEKRFVSEAKRFDIDTLNINLRNYYEVLGLRYTSDQKSIKEAYIKSIKQYHPDINRDKGATKRTGEINEAYAVLRDKKQKKEYDSRLSMGGNGIGKDAARSISNELLKRYSEMRERDFEEFNKRVSAPQHKDSINAAIEEVADWNRRFNRAVNNTVGKLRDYGRDLERLEALNRSLLKAEKDEERQKKLRDNLVRLEGLVKVYREVNKGISAIIEKIANDIATGENNIASRLRRAI